MNCCIYKGCSINKLQKQHHFVSLPNLKIQNIHFVGNFILNTCKNCFDLFTKHSLHVYYFPHQ